MNMNSNETFKLKINFIHIVRAEIKENKPTQIATELVSFLPCNKKEFLLLIREYESHTDQPLCN